MTLAASLRQCCGMKGPRTTRWAQSVPEGVGEQRERSEGGGTGEGRGGYTGGGEEGGHDHDSL